MAARGKPTTKLCCWEPARATTKETGPKNETSPKFPVATARLAGFSFPFTNSKTSYIRDPTNGGLRADHRGWRGRHSVVSTLMVPEATCPQTNPGYQPGVQLHNTMEWIRAMGTWHFIEFLPFLCCTVPSTAKTGPHRVCRVDVFVSQGSVGDSRTFGNISFMVTYFPDFPLYNCSCLTASGIGIVGHFPTLHFSDFFRQILPTVS